MTSEISLALPFGISPKNLGLLREFAWRGKIYRTSAALLVGANPAPAPAAMNRIRIPRIQATDGPFGLDDWLDRVSHGKVRPYVKP